MAIPEQKIMPDLMSLLEAKYESAIKEAKQEASLAGFLKFSRNYLNQFRHARTGPADRNTRIKLTNGDEFLLAPDLQIPGSMQNSNAVAIMGGAEAGYSMHDMEASHAVSVLGGEQAPNQSPKSGPPGSLASLL